MANSENEVNIRVTLQNELNEVKQKVNTFKTKQGFTAKSLLDTNQQIKEIEDILANTKSFTTEILQKARNVFTKITDNLTNAALKVSNASEELQKLTKQKLDVNNQLDELKTKRNDFLKGRYGISRNKDENGYTQITRVKQSDISGYTYAKMRFDKKLGAYVPGKDISLTTGDMKRAQQIVDSAGDYQIKKNGQVVTGNTLQESIDKDKDTLERANTQLKSIEDEMKSVQEVERKLTEAIAEQSKKEAYSSAESKDVVEVTSMGDKVSKTLNAAIDERQASETDKDIQDAAGDIQKSTDAVSGSIGRVLKQFSLFAIALRTVKTAAREAVATITQLDKALTDQSMVTGKTRKETYQMLKQYQTMAVELGSTTKEISETATEYMRQGKTAQEALTLTQAAVSAAKVAAVSSSESINYLTTALNGFQLSTDQAMKVSDKFAAVAATSATSYEEIATALSKVASQANLAGMSIDYTTALLAKGIETTREAPETIGTALKTIIARMREISDYGETLDGSTDVNNVETQLAYVGIKLKDTNGELRSTEDVLDELGKKWDTLNSNQQAAIAKALAGTRQQSRLIAMMSDYERVTELQEVSLRSSGATMAQMEKYSNSLEASVNRLATSWEKIVSSIAQSDTIIAIVNGITKSVEVLNKTILGAGNGWEQTAGWVIKIAAGAALINGALSKFNEKSLIKEQQNMAAEENVKNAGIERDREMAKRGEEAEKSGAIDKWGKQNLDIKENKDVEDQKTAIAETNKEIAAEELRTKQEVINAEKENNEAVAEQKQALDEETHAREMANEQELRNEQLETIRQLQAQKLQQEYDETVRKGGDTSGIEADIAKLESQQNAQRANEAAELTKKQNQLTVASDKVAQANQKVEATSKKLSQAQAAASSKSQKQIDLEKKKGQQQVKLASLQAKQKEVFLKQDKQAQAIEGKYQLILTQNNKLSALNTGILAAQNIKKAIYNTLQVATNALTRINAKYTAKAAIATTTDAAANTADAAAKSTNTTMTKLLNVQVKLLAKQLQQLWVNNPVGLILACVAAVAALGVGVVMLLSYFGAFESQASKTADAVNELSAEIYSLNEKATNLDNAIDAFDELDNKVIKTSQDLQDMKNQLDEAANYLDNEVSNDKNIKESFGGVSEQEWYNSLSSDRAKREYLEIAKQKALDEANQKRAEQLKEINKLTGSDRTEFFTSSEAKYVQARDAIYAINNNSLYGDIDNAKAAGKVTEDAASAIESVVSAIMEQVSAEEALDLANTPSRITAIVDSMSDLKTTIDDVDYSYAEILNENSSFDLKDQVEAYRQIKDVLAGDAAALKAFSTQYKEYSVFEEMGSDVLDFIDRVGLTIDDLNDLYTAYTTLQKKGFNISKEDYQDRYYQYLESLAKFDGDIPSAIEETFGDLLNQFNKGSDEYTKAWNALVDSFGGLVEQGVLNMGQNIDKFSNQVSTFYSKASEWSSMSETDKSEFLQDNYELFGGQDGEKLLEAFRSGNYNVIQEALSTNETLLENRKILLNQVEQELKIELAREGDDYNAAYVEQLQSYKRQLENEETLFQANLETRLDQQQKAIDQYKDMLEKEQDALTSSLDKRKDAYSKYFDAVNQEYDDQDYEETATRYTTNIEKLSSSTDAASMKQAKDLEQKLEDLEKDRLKTLRERAQDALTENIDDQVTEINDKFDKLLNDQQALLTALTTDSNSSTASLFSKLVSTQVSSGGLTAVGLEDYLQTLQSTLGNYLSDIDWDNISTTTDENNNVVLNISGKEVVLSSDDQQTLYNVILNAFKELGLAG